MNALHEPSAVCPSRLRIDRLLAGELAAAQAQQLEQHAANCARCRSLLADTKRGYEAFETAVPDAIVKRVHERAGRGRSWIRWSAPALAAAIALLAFTAWPEPRTETQLDNEAPPRSAGAVPLTVRSKGGPQLAFYVLHEGAVHPGTDGEHVQPGDRIQFAYTSERDAYLAVVSIDAARKASVYYAKDGWAAQIRAASRAVLNQSTLLDDTLGPETVYALVCTQPIAVAALLQALEREPERAPAATGCTVERYALLKIPR